MNERRTLIEGLKATPQVDSAREREFVHQTKSQPAPQLAPPTTAINRVPISTRMREDLAKALKKASLERQLNGVEPNTLQDILEEAIEPWLKSNGYLI